MERITFWGWPLHGAIDTLPQQICRPLALTKERHGEVADNEAICAHQPLSDDCGAHGMSIKGGGALSSHINARPVHFVGSLPLAGAYDVFRTIGSMFGSLAPRIPDGETGDRSLWIP